VFMNKKIMILIAGMLVLALLSACGKAKQAAGPAGHEAGAHGSGSGEPAGHHGGSGHGDDGAKRHEAASGLKASFSFAAGKAKANESAELAVRITDAGGKPVDHFELQHEKLMHLIVVNEDLSFFNHIHPEYKGNGTFTVATTFPAGGKYKLFADFVPKGGAATTISEWVNVEGPAKGHAEVKADSSLVKVVDGKEVALDLSSKKASGDVTLTFTIRDAQTGQPISDLEPYLGAVGHVVILSADAERYIHVHPIDETATGPKAQFATSFPQSGTYKIWGQFQHRGKVFTVPFTVDIQ